MIVEILGTAAVVGFMLALGGDAQASEVSDDERNRIWEATCAAWRNGLPSADAAMQSALTGAQVPMTPTTQELVREFWVRISAAGDRSRCPLPPWTIFAIGELPTVPTPQAPTVPASPGNPYTAALRAYAERWPGANSMVQISKANGGAGISGIAAAALVGAGAPNTSANRVALMKAIALSKWNLPYRLPRSATYYTQTADGVTWDVRGAFYPVNESVPSAVADGRLPKRNLKWASTPQKNNALWSSYGMLFVPDFGVVAGVVTPPTASSTAPGMLPDELLNALGVNAGDIVP